MNKSPVFAIAVVALFLSMALGCTRSVDQTLASPEVQQVLNNPTQSQQTLKFKSDNQAAFELELKNDGAKLVDGFDREIARLTNDANGKVKLKDASDRELGYVVPEENAWKLKTANQAKTLYVLRRQTDGDYKLESGTDQPIYRIKKREYGYEIETPSKQSLYKIKMKENKIILQDSSGKTVLSTKSQFSLMGMACFGFDVLSREQKAALAYTVTRSGE